MTKNVHSHADARVLNDAEVDAVFGGTEGYPGLPFGTSINVSPWSYTRPFDLHWALVGATGTLPR